MDRRDQPIVQQLYREPYSFQFFQAVRLLSRLPEALARAEQGKSKQYPEVARFRTHLSLSFAASEIHSLTPPEEPLQVPQMAVTFMGLFGTYGVLPRHYTQRLLELEYDHSRKRNSAMEYRAFLEWLDMFNHRMIWHFYRAWEKYRFPINFERGEHQNTKEPDQFTQALLAFIGLGTPALRDRIQVVIPTDHDPPINLEVTRLPDLALFRYAGLLSNRHRNQWGLRTLLQGLLQVDLEVQQFRGQWLPLEPQTQTRLGELTEDGQEPRLDESVIVGDRVWDIQGKIRLRLGPLSYRTFLDFLPDRSPDPDRKAFLILSQLARLYAGPEFDIEVQLVLKAAEVPRCQLSEDPITGSHLGWTCWLHLDTPTQDAEEAIFTTDDVPYLEPASLT